MLITALTKPFWLLLTISSIFISHCFVIHVFISFLDEHLYKERLWTHQPLDDFWRIGKQTRLKLEKCEKLELDESMADEILRQISKVKVADEVRVIYHDGFGYASASGLVSEINFIDKSLMVVKTRIKFEDINEVEIVRRH